MQLSNNPLKKELMVILSSAFTSHFQHVVAGSFKEVEGEKENISAKPDKFNYSFHICFSLCYKLQEALV